MKPHNCFDESIVLDSRTTREKSLSGEGRYRRRECLKCHRRFSTREVEEHTIMTTAEVKLVFEDLDKTIKNFRRRVKKLV